MFKGNKARKKNSHSEAEDFPGISADYAIPTDTSTTSVTTESQRAMNSTNRDAGSLQIAAKRVADPLSVANSKKETRQLKEKERKTKDEDRRKRREKDRKEDLNIPLLEEVDDVAEMSELESLKLNSYNDEIDKNFPPSFYETYSSLKTLARSLNAIIRFSEIVLIGPTSHGKSTLLEALVGHQFNFLGSGGATKRPLYFKMINNPAYETPVVTLRHDSVLPAFSHDMHLTLKQLPEELEKRMVLHVSPIVVLYESKFVMDITYIDTPGIPYVDAADYGTIMSLITSIVKPPERTIIYVEEASDLSKLQVVKFLKQIDLDSKRLIVVYTKFHTHLLTYTLTLSLNSYLWNIASGHRTFFVTLLPARSSRDLAEKDYQRLLKSACARDMRDLEILLFDRRFKRNMGIYALLEYIRAVAWTTFQEEVPEALHALCVRKKSIQSQILGLEAQVKALNFGELRRIAGKYATDFLQIVEQLVMGTSDGIPSVNGQTLEEEKAALGDFEWTDSYKHAVRLDLSMRGVPFRNAHVYGGQQFERLLSEFKIICEQMDILEISMDEVATVAGISKISNMPNYAWAASDLVHRQSEEMLLPLIDQLRRRALYVLKRFHSIAEVIAYEKRQTQCADVHRTTNVDMYPYFKSQFKGIFYKFVEHLAKSCQERCLSEFYCGKTVFWELTEFSDSKLLTDRAEMNPDELKNAVSKLASQLFKSIRDRITKNVALKFYNFMLVPIQRDLWQHIHTALGNFTDEQLDQYFRLEATKEKLEDERIALQEQLDTLVKQEAEFSSLALQFTLSHTSPLKS